MDQALSAIHQGNPQRLPVSLLLARRGKEIGLYVRLPVELLGVVRSQLYAAYPEAQLELVPESDRGAGDTRWYADLSLANPLFPIKRYGQFEDALNRLTADPLTALLAVLGEQNPAVAATVEITLRPVAPWLQDSARLCLQCLARPVIERHPRLGQMLQRIVLARTPFLRFAGSLLVHAMHHEGSAGPELTTSASRLHEREADLQASADKLGRLLFDARVRLCVAAPAAKEKAARQCLRALAGAFGVFSQPRLAAFASTRPRRWWRLSRKRGPVALLSAEEAATVWHPPTAMVQVPTLQRVHSRQFELPTDLPTSDDHRGLAVLGEAIYRRERRRCGIRPDDRLRHVLIQGKTGMGKSTLLAQMLDSDVRAGHSCALIDPHGDLCEIAVRAVPSARTNDVILFDAGDAEHPPAYNPLACRSAAERPLVASGLLSAFKKLYGEFWGPRMEHIFRNALLTVLERPGSSLLSLVRLLGDARYRQRAVASVCDPVVRAFWEKEFAGLPPKLQAEALAPLQNKLGHFVSSPLLRNIVGQADGRLELRRVMDEGKILLVNLSKGRTGDDASALLGSFLVTGLQLAAMSRADVPEEKRLDFFLYVDEFQNYATDSFAVILSEARKYRLSLTIANQYLAQMDESVRSAVFGNVGTMIVFQVGAEDAEVLAQQLGGGVTPEDLLSLPRHTAYARLLIDGMPSRPFALRTLPPAASHDDPHRAVRVRRYSRQRYARLAAHVEREIAAALTA